MTFFAIMSIRTNYYKTSFFIAKTLAFLSFQHSKKYAFAYFTLTLCKSGENCA